MARAVPVRNLRTDFLHDLKSVSGCWSRDNIASFPIVAHLTSLVTLTTFFFIGVCIHRPHVSVTNHQEFSELIHMLRTSSCPCFLFHFSRILL